MSSPIQSFIDNEFFELESVDKAILSDVVDMSDFDGWLRVSAWMSVKLVDSDVPVLAVDESSVYLDTQNFSVSADNLAIKKLSDEYAVGSDAMQPIGVVIRVDSLDRNVGKVIGFDDFSALPARQAVKLLMDSVFDPSAPIGSLANHYSQLSLPGPDKLLTDYKKAFMAMLESNSVPSYSLTVNLESQGLYGEPVTLIKTCCGRIVTPEMLGYFPVITDGDTAVLFSDPDLNKLTPAFYALLIMVTGYQGKSPGLAMGISAPLRGMHALIADRLLLSDALKSEACRIIACTDYKDYLLSTISHDSNFAHARQQYLREEHENQSH